MSDHTPTEGHLRNLYVAIIGGSAHTPSPCAEAEFDRAIAKIKADALREAADWLTGMASGYQRDSGQLRAGRDIIAQIHARADTLDPS